MRGTSANVRKGWSARTGAAWLKTCQKRYDLFSHNFFLQFGMLPLVFHKSYRRSRHHQRGSSRSRKAHLCTIAGKPALQTHQTRGRPRIWNHTGLLRTRHSRIQPGTGSQVRTQPSDNLVLWSKQTLSLSRRSGEGSSQWFLSWIPQTWKTCSLMSQRTQPWKNLRICQEIILRTWHLISFSRSGMAQMMLLRLSVGQRLPYMKLSQSEAEADSQIFVKSKVREKSSTILNLDFVSTLSLKVLILLLYVILFLWTWEVTQG